MPGKGDKECRLVPEDHREHRSSSYQDLMRFRVRDILLVSSLYDAFILEEDGGLAEQIYGEYENLELSSPPRVTRVSTGNEALVELKEHRYDLVITMTRTGDMDPHEFSIKVKETDPNIPVVLLVTDTSELRKHKKLPKKTGIDITFFWTGDAALFMAVIKYIEDSYNIGFDTDKAMVRVILIVEDSPRYYSLFLPILYREVMRQTQELVTEGLNENEKLLRRRARPKILMAHSYEDALDKYERFKDYLLGVISDVNFPMGDQKEAEAGFKLVEQFDRDIPVLMQSSREDYRSKAILGRHT